MHEVVCRIHPGYRQVIVPILYGLDQGQPLSEHDAQVFAHAVQNKVELLAAMLMSQHFAPDYETCPDDYEGLETLKLRFGPEDEQLREEYACQELAPGANQVADRAGINGVGPTR